MVVVYIFPLEFFQTHKHFQFIADLIELFILFNTILDIANMGFFNIFQGLLDFFKVISQILADLSPGFENLSHHSQITNQ